MFKVVEQAEEEEEEHAANSHDGGPHGAVYDESFTRARFVFHDRG